MVRVVIKATVSVRGTVMVNTKTLTLTHNPNPPNQELGES